MIYQKDYELQQKQYIRVLHVIKTDSENEVEDLMVIICRWSLLPWRITDIEAHL